MTRTSTTSADLYQRLIDSITDCAVIALDLDGRVLTWNPGARQITGYSAEETIGRSFSTFYPQGDAAAGKPQHDLRGAARDGRFEEDMWRVAKDGSWFRARVAIAALRNEEGLAFGFTEVMRPLGDTLSGEAEHAVRSRDEMLAIVAHDLRNPMHAIMGAASMLALQAPDERHQRWIALIQRSAKEMERLLNDLLDVARIEAGQLVVRHDPIDVRALLEETVEGFLAQAAAVDVTLVCEVGGGLRPVAGDRDRLVQVVSNLIANALKFTPKGRGVSVRATAADDAAQISVKDSGSGIPPEDLPRVFDRFWKADRRSTAGAGLGLAICRSVVEAHGGRIWAASRLGRGTTFHFTLPYAAP